MPQLYTSVSQVVPSVASDGTQKQVRGDRYGDPFVIALPEPQALAAEGTLFSATNPTFGTAIALSTATRTTFVATECALLIRNTAGASTGPFVILDRIIMSFVGAATTSTSADLGVIIDTANRYSSGGTALTEVNNNTGNATAPVAEVFFGNVTSGAAVAARQVGRAKMITRAAPTIAVGDIWILGFGGRAEASGGSASGVATGTGASLVTMNFPAVALGPGNNHSFLLHYWAPAQTASPTAEVTVVWHER